MPDSDSEKTGRRWQAQPDGPRKQQATHRRGTSSFEARFGRVILEHGIAAIPAGLFHFQRLLGLDAKHLWFVAYILSCKWDADLPYPSLNKMERCTGVDIQALYRYKKALISQGYLQVYRRLTEKGGYDTDAYDFSELFDRLEECIIAELPQPNPIRADISVPGPAGDLIESGEIDSSFVARYGRVIVRYGVAAIPRGIFTYQRALGLTPQQVWFVGYILSFKWNAALPYPSIEKMSANTGYNRAYLHEIKASLVNSGYLRIVHRTNEQGGQDTNAYDFSGLLDAIRAQLETAGDKQILPTTPASELVVSSPEPEVVARDIEPAARRRSRLAAQARASKIASQKGVEDQANPGLIEQTGVGINRHTHPFGNGQTEVGINGHTPAAIKQQTPSGINGQMRGAITGQIAVSINKQTDPILRAKPALLSPGKQREVSLRQHESESIKVEELKRDDSNRRPRLENSDIQSSTSGEKSGDIEEHILYSPYIAAVMSDFSNELGDANHVFSNVTQALRIYTRSGLSEAEFSAHLFEARKVVRTYQGKQGITGIQNKMAYFFVTLRRLAAPGE